MTYSATFEEHESHVHARYTGTHTPENVLRFLQEAHDECVRRNGTALLLELSSTGPNLDAASTYRVVADRSAHGTRFRKIAYVDTSDRNPSGKQFAETVAVNRGANVRLFRSLDEARAWLDEGQGRS
jgi:hypothetical protein